MRLSALLLVVGSAGILRAQETPITVLPYTPALEPKFIDKSVDPCTNFYRFACGNWNKLNPIPADQSDWDVYSKLTDENQHLLWGILQQASAGGSARSPNEQKIGDLFSACMNEPDIDAAGLKPIQPQFRQIAALTSVDQFAAYLAAQHRTGLSEALFSFGADQDFDNSSQMIAAADAGGLGLPDRDYYTKTDAKSVELRQKYLAHIQHVLALSGEAAAEAQTDAQSAMTIETALAQVSLTRVERRDPHNLRHRLSRDELVRLAPRFNWSTYLQQLNAPAFQTVNVAEPRFFSKVNELLAAQPLAAWRAYFRWQLLYAQERYLPTPFKQAQFDFYSKALRGTPAEPPRWKTCTRLISYRLGDALGQVFVEKTFAPRTKADALRMTQEIERTMAQDIDSLTWMSAATKEQALLKLKSIVNKIGYPDKWRDYSSIRITPTHFLPDIVATAAFEYDRQLQKIGKPVDRAEWLIPATTVDAYYSPQMNDINFPAAVLQPPLFDPKLDDAPNYGNTGATIGHELTHGFDDEGRQFDGQGNLKDWWTPADAKAFNQRIQCVRDQYAQYVIVDDIHINSELTSGEDVADLGGTLLAYLAWKKESTAPPAQSADGYTPDQRFFIGMGQWACGDSRPESKRMRATVDPHSPEEYRINGVVANLPQFGAAFGCHVGQPMMRENACRVW